MTLLQQLRAQMVRNVRTPAIAALIIWLSIGSVVLVGAQSSLETPSPAQGRVQVVSQGMTNRPAQRAAWRVVRRTLPVRTDARPSDRLEGGAGFLLAYDGPIFVTDQDTKQRYRLAPGEAQFVPIGANQTWASLESGPITAYSLELAVRDTIDEAGTDDVVYRSGSFGMLEGDYDLDLLRTRQPHNERSTIDGSEFPVLIFVTQGQVDVTANGETERLYSGHGGAYEGEVRVRTASSNDAVFVAAVVAASVGGGRTSGQPTATPGPTDTPTEEPTEEVTEEATQEPTAEPTDEAEVAPTAEATDESRSNQDGTNASGAVEEIGGSQTSESTEEATEEATEEPTAKPTKEPTPQPTFESRTGSSEIRLELRLCPEYMSPDDFDPRDCRRAQGDFNLALVTPFGEELRLRHANRHDNDSVRWSQLKSGDYVLEVREFPKGYGAYALDEFPCCTQGDGFRIRIGRGDLVIGTIYFFPS
jgi:hypothetical protein